MNLLTLKNSLLISLLFTVIGCTEKVAPKAGSDEPAQVQAKRFNYSLDELNSASNYLTTLTLKRTDDQTNKKKSAPLLKCDPSDKDINMWSMQIKSLIDEQNPATAKPYDEKDKSYTAFCGSRLHLYLLSLSR